VGRLPRSRQFEAPHAVAELCLHKETCLGQREKVPVDRNSIQFRSGKALRELGVTRGDPKFSQLAQDDHALVGHPEALLHK
jgi:hypothetical protein